MTTLRVGIADCEEMKAWTMRVARGEEKVTEETPKVWFTSIESFARILSAGNRELLRVIDEKAPGSVGELAEMTGRAKSNLSRTLRKMAVYGLVRMDKGQGRRLVPRVAHDRVELDLRLTHGKRGSRS